MAQEDKQQSGRQGLVTGEATQGPVLRRTRICFKTLLLPPFKFLVTSEWGGALHFHFALDPRNYLAVSDE